MKKSFHRLILFFLLSASSFTARSAIFAPESRLKEGKWVKISVGESGIYEIPYAKLRELGFSDPRKVGVFGHGGKMQTEHFTDANGKQTYIDDLTPVGTYHSDGKLIFYGLGAETIGYLPSRKAFMKSDRNIYTDFGHYFLSDSAEAMAVEETVGAIETEEAEKLDRGVDYVYHEQDLTLGLDGTGRLYLGENFTADNPKRLEWRHRLHDLVPSAPAMMYAGIYAETHRVVTVSYGAEGGEGFSKTFTMPGSEGELQTVNSSPAEISIPSADARIYVSATLTPSQTYKTRFCHLDHWILTYTKSIPLLKEETQSRIAFTQLEPDTYYSFTLSSPGCRVMRISGGTAKSVITPDDDTAGFRANSDTESFVVFDPSRELLSPLSYTEVANTNLHADFDCDIDMLIISLPEYLDGARRLADTDYRLNGVKAAIAQPEDIYNEFSSGNPDAMAYRAFGKMVYEKSRKRLKNILFIGPIRADMKLDAEPGKSPRHLIYYQFKNESPSTLGYNSIGFYANFNSYTSASIDRRTLNTGIGLLPVTSAYELDRYTDKVERYLTAEGNEYRVNHILSAGGSANNHMHVSQADRIDSLINLGSDGKFRFTPIGTSYFDITEARSRIRKELGESAMAFYLGHANPSYIDVDRLIAMGDLQLIDNSYTPFMAFGGCRLTNTDRGGRGIAEALVLSTDCGLIASLATMRETFASPNFGMFSNLATVLTDDIATSGKPLSLGEIYARTLTQSSSYNELTYALIGDPSLPLVYATRQIAVDNSPAIDASAGEVVVEGHVAAPDGSVAEDFSGEAVLRLMSPTSKVFLEATCESKSKSDSIPYENYCPPREVIAMGLARVEAGRFKAVLKVPRSAGIYSGKGMQIALGAYSKELRLGAGGTADIDYAPGSGNPSAMPETDNTPPVFEQLAYIPESNAIRVAVSDDTALNLGTINFNEGLRLTLDGKILAAAHRYPKRLEHDRPAYTTDIMLPEGITAGRHQAVVSVNDQAGNTVSSTLEFTVGESYTATLDVDEKLAFESATLSISGATGPVPASLRLHILDREGETVVSLPFAEGRATWNLLDDSGKRVDRGLYKAVARPSDPSESPFISSTATIAVF